jgi:hypothetical protein
MTEPKQRAVEQEARRILAWHAHGGNVRQVDSIVLRDMDANEDAPRRVHLIPIGEAIGFAITDDRAAPDDKAIVYVSSHALGAAFAALGYSVVPTAGGAIVPPRFAVPDYKPEPDPWA